MPLKKSTPETPQYGVGSIANLSKNTGIGFRIQAPMKYAKTQIAALMGSHDVSQAPLDEAIDVSLRSRLLDFRNLRNPRRG
jgi:hypothetical protein